MTTVVVTGARGGVGATTLAVALARRRGAVLVDTDGPAGGVDVWLGAEGVPGVRWSGLGLGGGALAAEDLVAALPVESGVPLLAADAPALPGPAELGQILRVLTGRAVVVDLARGAAQVPPCRLAVVVAPGGAVGAAAAHATVAALRAGSSTPPPVGLVVVGRALTGATMAAAAGAAVLATCDDVADLDRAAAGIAEALDGPGHGVRAAA